MFRLRKYLDAGGNYVPPITDGAYAIFKTTGNSSAKYTYSGDATSVAQSFSSTIDRTISVGNATRGVFFQSSSSGLSARYTYASNTITDDGAALGVATGSGSASCSNASFGLVSPNVSGVQPFMKYTFAANTSAASTSATVALSGGAGCGNDTYGIFAMGGTATAGTNVSNRYTYSDDSVIAGGNLTTTSKNGGAAGNMTMGAFVTGGSSANLVTNTYSYASNTFAVGNNLSAAIISLQATGNSACGIFSVRTGVATTARCDYASDTFSVGTSLPANTAATNNGATSNGNTGIL
jgi:hypothetical protein